MRKYSPVIGLLAVITAMAIFQIGTLNADASSATISSQSNQAKLTLSDSRGNVNGPNGHSTRQRQGR